MEVVTGFAVVGALVLGFGLISRRLQSSPLTPPMVFVVFGAVVGAHGLGLLDIGPESHVAYVLAELTLVMVLFTDATRIDLRKLRREHDIPVRLLAVGLPLTMALGFVLAWKLLPGLGLWGAAVLGVILAPTDAALGQAVVSDPKVPVRIRQALNVESGLNDGMSLTALIILLCATGFGEHVEVAWYALLAKQLLLGPLAGMIAGWIGGKLVNWGAASGWMTESFQRLASIGIALLAYAFADLIGGNGFIAAFSAGLVLGNTSRGTCAGLYEFAETEVQLLTLLSFLAFGSAMVLPVVEELSWQIVLYAVLSLTLVRMVPVALSLIGLGLRRDTVLFLGWFGPRGIASILLALAVLMTVPGAVSQGVALVVGATVLLSIFAHGLTARPAARAYAARTTSTPDEAMPELQSVSEMPVRIPHR